MKYSYIFGNTPALSEFELQSFDQAANPLEFAEKLGGTVKIVEEIGEIGNISAYLKALNLPKIDFGISGRPDLSKKIKSDLEESGIKARFVLPRNGNELSSVVVKKQNLIEIYVQGNTFGRTIWVQDFESWNKRDYDRPKVDPHAGMLPPKVARMMVNIAKGDSLLDPFCGVGTILAEAQMVGRAVFGSDTNTAQVENTKANLHWLNQGQFVVFQSDARQVSKKMKSFVDAIVTEPFLGLPHAKSLDPKLANLYVDCLADWKNKLNPNGRVVMIIPSTSNSIQLDLVKTVLDKAILMGYSEFHKPIEYFRPQAFVKRNICFLEYGAH